MSGIFLTETNKYQNTLKKTGWSGSEDLPELSRIPREGMYAMDYRHINGYLHGHSFRVATRSRVDGSLWNCITYAYFPYQFPKLNEKERSRDE